MLLAPRHIGTWISCYVVFLAISRYRCLHFVGLVWAMRLGGSCVVEEVVNLDWLSTGALAMAYRKAKVDLYYSNDARAAELVEYEAHLDEKLEALLKNLVNAFDNEDIAWSTTETFIGGHTLIAKGFTAKSTRRSEQGLEDQSEKSQAQDFYAGAGERFELNGKAAFRVLSKCSIDMHVLGALWLGTVGARLEAALGKAPERKRNAVGNTDSYTSSFGDRLRRTRDGAYNWYAPGSFKPYLHQYRSWQDQGLNTMNAALERDESIVVVTADFKSFFPSLEPDFLLDADFLAKDCQVELTNEERKLTELLVGAIKEWGAKTQRDLRQTHEATGTIPVGLPIGYPASALIANLALSRFDRTLRNQLNPLYYGRYVDDLMIVLRRSEDMRSGADVWKWISDRVDLTDGEKLDAELVSTGRPMEYSSRYLVRQLAGNAPEAIILKLAPAKTKCYFLAGAQGKLVLASIQQAVRARTSEWRALPDIPRSARDVPRSLIAAVGEGGEAAESLRLVHTVTTSRAHFALRLRDFEALAKDLPDDAWAQHRSAFFTTMADHFCGAERMLDFAKYIPRLIQLAVLTSDWVGLKKLLKSLVAGTAALVAEASRGVRVEINGCDVGGVEQPRSHESIKCASNMIQEWFREFVLTLEDAIVRAAHREIPVSVVDDISAIVGGAAEGLADKLSSYSRYFVADLAAIPFRAVLLPHEWSHHTASAWLKGEGAISAPRLPNGLEPLLKGTARFLVQGVRNEFPAFFKDEGEPLGEESITQALKKASGFRYSTRPLSAGELSHLTRVGSLLVQPGFEPSERESLVEKYRDGVLVLRGHTIDPMGDVGLGEIPVNNGTTPIIQVPRADDDDHKQTIRVGLAAIRTDRERLSDALHFAPQLTLKRYQGLCELMRGVINGEERADMLVCPELSIPREWFSRLAFKLQSAGTSLIAGVEYKPDGVNGREVSNQVWANLAHSAWGFRGSYVYVQDKQRPSRGEERNLLSETQAVLKPKKEWEYPPIINLDGVYFSLLVCSELTNLSYRAYLRSKVDLLVVPEWNQDVKTFASIVEASAFDMHLYVAQANNRLHGDTRVRGPYKDEWRRDIVKVSGGSHDYVLVGEIDIAKLRRFQSSHDGAGGEFKTLPDGFNQPSYRSHWKPEDKR